MKNFYILLISSVILYSCSGNDPEAELTCNPTKVSYKINGTTSTFTFQGDGNEGVNISSINVYEGTDSAQVYVYAYQGSDLHSISFTSDGSTTTYMSTLSNGKLSKLTSKTDAGVDSEELRFEYNGTHLTKLSSYLANASGTFFQVSHTNFAYNGEDLSSSENHADLAALFSLIFGIDPSGYAPTKLFTNEYVASTAPNPLYGYYSLYLTDYTASPNLPANIKVVSGIDGSTISSESFTITTNEQGNPTLATSDKSSIETTYLCQ